MKRIVPLLLLPLAAACSNGSPIVVADFRTPSAAAAFLGAGDPPGTLDPWIAVASSRGDQLRLVNPADDLPARAPNISSSLSIPTMARPTYLASGSLGDGGPDLLVVASTGTEVQLVGTWLPPVNGIAGFGVVENWDLSAEVDPGSVIAGLTVVPEPSATVTGTPPVAAPVPGKAWVLVAFSDASGAGGKLLVLEVARSQGGDSIALAAAPLLKPLGFNPAGIAAAPDNLHVYFATGDFVPDANGNPVLGVAEVSMAAGLAGAWPVRGLDGRAPTTTVAAAFVGERTQANWWDFQAPALRVYAAIAASSCGPAARIACGIATFDPARGGLAADPAPAIGSVPPQPYRAPMPVAAIPLAFTVAMPPSTPATVAPGLVNGSQVCWSPPAPDTGLPACPDAGLPGGGYAPFNGAGVGQRFMGLASSSQWWTTAVGSAAAGDGSTYIQDVGRFGPPNFITAMNDTNENTATTQAHPVGPAGPIAGTSALGFPSNTAAVALRDQKGVVDTDPAEMLNDVIVWPGFTGNESWQATYQGILPGLSQRAVLGLAADGQTLYVAPQDPYAAPANGTLPADVPWVPSVRVADADFGVHPGDTYDPADISQFYLDVDPCLPTRPNWVPSDGGAPLYDATKIPQPHEAPIAALLPPDPVLYPGGAFALAVPADATLASEYACLVAALRAMPGTVLTAQKTVLSSPTDYVRGAWVRAGGFLLTGTNSGYAGRPQLDVRYDFAWADEDSLSGEALVLARKARRFWYPAFYEPCDIAGCYIGFPELTDPMQPGPVVGFTLARYCQSGITPADCDATTSPPARDAGVSFTTRSGFVPTTRRPANASVGTSGITFDKSTIPGLEWKGRVFYTTFSGGALYMVPPGLDSGQPFTIR